MAREGCSGCDARGWVIHQRRRDEFPLPVACPTCGGAGYEVYTLGDIEFLPQEYARLVQARSTQPAR